jgi:hypothetical protein
MSAVAEEALLPMTAPKSPTSGLDAAPLRQLRLEP